MNNKKILNLIRQYSKGIKAKEVAEILHLSKNNISGTLTKLKSYGLIYNFEAKWYFCRDNNMSITCSNCGTVLAFTRKGRIL